MIVDTNGTSPAAYDFESDERKRLHSALDSLFDPLVIFEAARDAEGRIVDLLFTEVNAAACEFEHEPHDALLGASLSERHSAGRTTGLYDLFVRVVETGEPLVLNDYIYPLESLAGEERRFDIRGAHLGDGLVLTWRDVTARYEAAERIANSERRLRVVLDNLLDSHVMLRALRDESGEIVDLTFAEVNLAASAFSGEPRNAIVGTRVLDGGGLGIGPEVFAMLVDVLETGDPLVLDDYTELDNPAHAGHYFDMRAVRTGDSISLMFRDVTERHTAARALAESEERLRLAIANSPIAIGLLTPEGYFFTANPAMCEMLGRDLLTITSLSFRDMTHPDDVERDSARFEDLVNDRIPNFRVRKRYLRPDGSLVWGDLSVGCIRNPDRTARYLIAQIADITARVEAEEALRESQAELEVALQLTRAAHDQADQELRTTRILLQAAEALAASVDSGQLSAALARFITDATGSRVTISHWDEARGELCIAVSVGEPPFPVGTPVPWRDLNLSTQRVISEWSTRYLDFDAANEPRLRRYYEELHARLALQIPVIFRKRLIGLIVLDQPGLRRQYSEREVALVEGIAAQAAVALENARLYEAEHGIAETLQETLTVLPARVSGVVFSHAYQSATHESGRVGGDFVDIFEVREHVVGITLGDVSGKGIEAAVTTAMIRNTLRAYALDGAPSASEVVAKANHLMRRFTAPSSFVTLWFGLLDSGTGQLSYVSAGHPPALMVAPGGEARELECRCPILGVFDEAQYHDSVTILLPGERLVLYSDGVPEARSPEGEFLGAEGLLETIRENEHELTAELSDVIMENVMTFSEGILRDDVAILVVELGDGVWVRTPETEIPEGASR